MLLAERNQARSLIDLAALIVDEELCINLRGRLMHCTACSDVCQAGALKLTPDAIEVDGTLCTGCCGCLPGCPAGALRSSAFVPERFVASLSEQGYRDLHCRFSEVGGGGVVIPCHAVLDARLLSAARGEGVTELRLHGLNKCETCPHGDARGHIQSIIAHMEKWLGDEAPELDTDPQIGIGAVEGGRDYQDQPHMDRRAFLRFGGAKSISQAVEWLLPGLTPQEEESEAIPFYQADDYPQRQSAYLQTLVDRVDRVPWRSDRILLFRMRRTTESCSACLSCGERCPTGALHGSETPQARTLSFDPAACTDCGLCMRVCPHNAILSKVLRDTTPIKAGRKSLITLQQLSCRQCGSPFPPTAAGTDLCPLCSNEQELDEAWFDMISGGLSE
jgi:ferredoxin